MKRCLTFAVVALLFGSSAFAQSKARAENVPVIPHDVRPFLKLPQGLYLGEVMGVATNSKGNLFVYHRSGHTRLFEFDKNDVREDTAALLRRRFCADSNLVPARPKIQPREDVVPQLAESGA